MWGWGELYSLYLLPVGIAFLVRVILRTSRRNPAYWVGYAALLWAAVAGVTALFVPRVLIDMLLPFQLLLLVYVLVLIGAAVVAALRGNHDARVFSLGIGFLALFGTYDVLREWRLFDDYGFQSHWGLLIFVGMLLYILVRRIVRDHQELQHYSRQLEEKTAQIEHSHKELEKLYAEIDLTQKEVIFRLSEIAEVRSKETGNHVRRVAEYSRILAKACGLDDELVRLLRLAAPMHDVGKLGIPDNILHKPGKLTAEEFDVIKSHTRIGFEMLYKSPREVFTAAAIVAYEHHEKFDGSGYPCGKAGEDIHIFGRITAVAERFRIR